MGTRKLIVVGKLKTCVGEVILEISIGVEIIFGVPVVNSIFCKLLSPFSSYFYVMNAIKRIGAIKIHV